MKDEPAQLVTDMVLGLIATVFFPVMFEQHKLLALAFVMQIYDFVFAVAMELIY